MIGNGDEYAKKRHNALAITNFGEMFVPDVLSSEEGFESEQDVPMMSLQKKLKELEEKHVVLTQDEYDRLGSYDDNKIYFITE